MKQEIYMLMLGTILLLGPIIPLNFKGTSEAEALNIWLGFYFILVLAFLAVVTGKLMFRGVRVLFAKKGSEN
ncbi:hypothetical protein [Aurantivibrio plasticivorans]